LKEAMMTEQQELKARLGKDVMKITEDDHPEVVASNFMSMLMKFGIVVEEVSFENSIDIYYIFRTLPSYGKDPFPSPIE
jgi:hypothetical protein